MSILVCGFILCLVHLPNINVALGRTLLDQNAELFIVIILEMDNIAYWISFVILETICIWRLFRRYFLEIFLMFEGEERKL